MNKQQSHTVAAAVGSITDNIKAEVIVAAALEAGVPLQDIVVENAGSFTRPYRKDVLGVVPTEAARGRYALKVQLSRNGLYDLLPEALSHTQHLVESAGEGVSALTNGYKKRKKEEAQARKFFRPLENEFFYQGVCLEQEEQELLYNSSAAFYSFLAEFWDIAGELPGKYEASLLRLLPVIHTIAGDFDGIRACLEALLEVPVYYEIDHRSLQLDAEYNQLGKGRLGQSFTAGCSVHAVPFVTYTLGPVRLHQLLDFLPGGAVDQFLQKFLAYTVPFESEVQTRVLSGRYEKQDDDTSFGILGYSATL